MRLIYFAHTKLRNCILANLISTYGIIDIIFGSLATLLAALCTMKLGQNKNSAKISVKVLACLPPVVFNAVIIGAVIAFSVASNGAQLSLFIVNAAQIALGEFVVLFVVGLPLLVCLPKMHWFKLLLSQYTNKSEHY